MLCNALSGVKSRITQSTRLSLLYKCFPLSIKSIAGISETFFRYDHWLSLSWSHQPLFEFSTIPQKKSCSGVDQLNFIHCNNSQSSAETFFRKLIAPIHFLLQSTFWCSDYQFAMSQAPLLIPFLSINNFHSLTQRHTNSMTTKKLKLYPMPTPANLKTYHRRNN